MIDYDEMTMEANLFPWLDSDVMGDPCCDDSFTDNYYFEDEEDDDTSWMNY